jgi:membrane protein DedA with SNARE-associated domain
MESQAFVDQFIAFVRERRAWAGPIVFVLAFGESLAFISLVLPFWLMLVAIGTALTALGLDFVTIWVSASLGAAAGDWLSYWIGDKFKNRIRHVWPLKNHPRILPAARLIFRRYGWLAIVIGRFSGPLRASIPLVAGITSMPIWTFQAANVGSAFLWAGILLSPGLMWQWIGPWAQPFLDRYGAWLGLAFATC